MTAPRAAAPRPPPQSSSEIEETLKRVSAYPGAPRARVLPAALRLGRAFRIPTRERSLPLTLLPAALATPPGVQGLIVINADGIPIRTTLDPETSVQVRKQNGMRACVPRGALTRARARVRLSPAQYAALVSHFTAKARSVLKALPLPGVSSDAGAVRCVACRSSGAHSRPRACALTLPPPIACVMASE